MPQSRKRPGHHYQKPSDIPGKQRTSATTVCIVLFAIFGGIIGFFADGSAMIIGLLTLLGGVAGYFIGKAMIRDAKS
jgi:uncharacterized membrane protein (UPF0136 family)